MTMCKRPVFLTLLFFCLSIYNSGGLSSAHAEDQLPFEVIEQLAALKDRSIGTEGNAQAADYISSYFTSLGLEPQDYLFQVPTRKVINAHISIAEKKGALKPLFNNAVTPQSTGLSGLTGPLYFVGDGNLSDLDGKLIEGSILVMNFNSGRQWLTAASLGAQAVIFVDHGHTRSNAFFIEKEELSPLQFPCFWMTSKEAELLFGPLSSKNGLISNQVEILSSVVWETVTSKNIYCLIKGSDPQLSEKLLIIEAFYDSTRYVEGSAPGADEAVSISNLLGLAHYFSNNPPKRSVLLIATNGHAQALHGMRDVIWSLQERSKVLRDYRKELRNTIKAAKKRIATLTSLSFPLVPDPDRDLIISSAIMDDLKMEVDRISRVLMKLRLEKDASSANKSLITELADQRFTLRKLSWREQFNEMPDDERTYFKKIISQALITLENRIIDNTRELESLESAMDFRQLCRDFTIDAVLSLHLSSHGEGIGGFHRGWLYRLRSRINRTGIFSTIGQVFSDAAAQLPTTEIVEYIDTLRPSRLRSWDSYFIDKPFLGGEISSLAGYIGVSLVTVGDGRTRWGTPWDTVEHLDKPYLEAQYQLLRSMVSATADAPALHADLFPRNGFSSVRGTSNLLLQGELFADYPAEQTILLSYQGIAKLYSSVNSNGTFLYKGIADSKNVLDKLIIEGYRFDPVSGEIIWAIDKKETGKTSYRVKMLRRAMKTRLIMFACNQTTVFDLLEPRSLDYMTKLYLFDGRRDAPPQRYWYSRIDTRQSNISSIYLEPGSWLKLTLSDNVITRKLILSNGNKKVPLGFGYPVEEYPAIIHTAYRSAMDAWTLLLPRIENLESHGIFDERINNLKNRGLSALNTSTQQLKELNYTAFREQASASLALAARVYTQIEKTQKDVLFGVLFYIALFVPFAFCMERFLFSYANIYKRIVAFSLILTSLILVIYNVHPAFDLAYSPMVVILAFFIIGLSLLVTLIIFFRFEEEMILLQRHASQMSAAEISRWKAFVAAFFLGVSNLRRRRMRTILTCTTLIILTFTIMSFTTVKSNQQENRMFFNDETPYQGLLLKKLSWKSMPPQAAAILEGSMESISSPAQRVWLEASDVTRSVHVPLRYQGNNFVLNGLIGLGYQEADVTGLDQILSRGRWFKPTDHQAIILSDRAATTLQLDFSETPVIDLFGTPFTVIGTFSGELLDRTFDLDGEPLTPVIFPDEMQQNMSDAEFEALESGEDVRNLQSRYSHIPGGSTAIIPAPTLLAMGGELKNIALRSNDELPPAKIASTLVDRFSLAIFAGDQDGVWLYNLSDTMAYSGVPNIIIPLLISILIVLNTMISSVYERKNEIGIYTSVGLAPSHVSFLFVAEAMALAVISVVLGYLVAQVSAALLSDTRYWEGITVNYSSLAGVAAMLLVIGVVLISVIYPSRVAARIAIPDVKRSFKLPEPVNDQVTVMLPFFMKYEEHSSIGGYLHTFFSGHQDISHGRFSTGFIDLLHTCATVDEIGQAIKSSADPCAYHCVHLRSRVWLSPFDFGIMQLIDIQFCPARDNLEFLEIKISIKRESGEKSQWQRINKLFIHELRKQLLIWRSLDAGQHEAYAQHFQSISEAPLTPQSTND